MRACWYSWSPELCSLHPSKPSLAVCSSVALMTSKAAFPDGRPQPVQAAVQCHWALFTHCVLGMEGCLGSWLLFAATTKKNAIRGRIYTFSFFVSNDSSPSGAAHWRFDWPRQAPLSWAAEWTMCWTSDLPERTDVCFSATSLTHLFKAPKQIHFHADGNPSLPLCTWMCILLQIRQICVDLLS